MPAILNPFGPPAPARGKIPQIDAAPRAGLTTGAMQRLDELWAPARTRTVWANLLGFLAQQSARHPPPGRNAASGRWTAAVRGGLRDLRDRFPRQQGDDGILSSAYEMFHAGLAEAFDKYLVAPGRWNQATPDLNLGDLLVGADAIAHGLVARPRLETFVRDVERRAADLNRRGKVVWNGKRANGHLAWRVAEAARAARFLLGRRFATRPSELAARVLAKALCYVEALPACGHAPWLRADWQLRFELTCRVAAAALKHPGGDSA